MITTIDEFIILFVCSRLLLMILPNHLTRMLLYGFIPGTIVFPHTRYQYESGAVYEGQWRNGQHHGKGTYTLAAQADSQDAGRQSSPIPEVQATSEIRCVPMEDCLAVRFPVAFLDHFT